MNYRCSILYALLMACAMHLSAQTIAMKSNLLYTATTTPNVGAEITIGKKLTGQLFYGLNPWEFEKNKKIRHWLVMPELRYWTCSPFNGHFVGIHALGGQFNLAGINIPKGITPFGKLDDIKHHHYEGYYLGVGLTYGYQWILSRHWNFEASIGVGYTYLDYTRYQCATCGFKEQEGNTHYLGPTKEVLSLIYVF